MACVSRIITRLEVCCIAIHKSLTNSSAWVVVLFPEAAHGRTVRKDSADVICTVETCISWAGNPWITPLGRRIEELVSSAADVHIDRNEDA